MALSRVLVLAKMFQDGLNLFDQESTLALLIFLRQPWEDYIQTGTQVAGIESGHLVEFEA